MWKQQYLLQDLYVAMIAGRDVLVHVCGGGEFRRQTEPCDSALLRFAISEPNIKLTVEVFNPSHRHDLGPKGVIDWLLQSDFHIIRTHLHQGIKYCLGIELGRTSLTNFRRRGMYTGHYNDSPTDWNIRDMLCQLPRLGDHSGFPNVEFLQCPIFLQDKFEYLAKIPEISLPTLQVLPFSHLSIMLAVLLFCFENVSSESLSCLLMLHCQISIATTTVHLRLVAPLSIMKPLHGFWMRTTKEMAGSSKCRL